MSPASAWAVRRVHVATLIMVAVALVYGAVGIITFNYPPEYLALSPVWAGVHILGSATTALFLASRCKWLAVLSGALVIGAALFRAAAIFVEVGAGAGSAIVGSNEPLRSSFVIAGLTWSLIALLLWAVWPLSSVSLLGKTDE